MHMGKIRHCADIRADQADQSGQGVINLQYGAGYGATQTGMQIGGRRDILIRHHENKDDAWVNNYEEVAAAPAAAAP